jgi:hypothetical protein
MRPLAKAQSAIYVTSSFRPTSGRVYEKFVNKVQKYGWQSPGFEKLTQDLHVIALNFKEITGGARTLRVILSEYSPEMEENIIRINGDEITVNMRQAPQRVIDYVPHCISFDLISSFFLDYDYPTKTRLMIESLRKSELVSSALDSIVNFYINERQAGLDVNRLRDLCLGLIYNSGREIVDRKFAYQLLRPRSFTGQEIEAIIDIMVSEIKNTVNQPELGVAEFESLGAVARLAMFATLAKKAGNTNAYLKCLDLLKGPAAEAMAWIEFAQIEIAEVETIPKHVYPASAKFKIEQSVRGYSKLFHIFQKVMELYYDNVEITD